MGADPTKNRCRLWIKAVLEEHGRKLRKGVSRSFKFLFSTVLGILPIYSKDMI
jgi:hypothetical protein